MDVEDSIYELPHAPQEAWTTSWCALGLDAPAPKLASGRKSCSLKNPKHHVRIGMVGKYMDLQDSYLSVNESVA